MPESDIYLSQSLDRLAAAVILRALEDLSGSNLEIAADARAWLLCDGLQWFRGLGLRPQVLKAYIEARYTG